MAYANLLYEVYLSVTNSPTILASTGDKLTWSPQYIPHTIRAVSSVITTAVTVTATVVNFTTRGTAGSNSGIVAGDIAILKHLTTYVAGNVVYKDGLQKLISPKQEVVVNVGTAGSAGAAVFSMLIETTFEVPGNNTNMIATT